MGRIGPPIFTQDHGRLAIHVGAFGIIEFGTGRQNQLVETLLKKRVSFQFAFE